MAIARFLQYFKTEFHYRIVLPCNCGVVVEQGEQNGFLQEI
jgi:hypothetical protein